MDLLFHCLCLPKQTPRNQDTYYIYSQRGFSLYGHVSTMNRHITMKTKLALFPRELKIGKKIINPTVQIKLSKKYRNIFPWELESKVSLITSFFFKLYVNDGNRIQ